jgi:hypothetical protein
LFETWTLRCKLLLCIALCYEHIFYNIFFKISFARNILKEYQINTLCPMLCSIFSQTPHHQPHAHK